MQDKLLIATRCKKTIEYIDKIIINFPVTEINLKNKISNCSYELLESIYRANIYKESFYMKEVIVKIRMLDYYIKISFDKKIIGIKKYENLANHLLEINKMVVSWVNDKKEKQSL